MEIVRLKEGDYNEWLSVLNTVFTEHNKKEMNFEAELPKMCVKDDYHMGMHFAIKDDGKICSLLGVYPIKVKIGESDFLFSTVGNVATLPLHEGKGYMRVLMQEAMRELERIGADASRLGGARQRYNRYGYEASGTLYKFSVNSSNTKYCYDGKEELIFKEISLNDKKELAFINRLRKNEKMYVERSNDDTYFGDFASLVAWQNIPYIVLNKSGDMLGYISVSKNGREISDICANDLEAFKNIVFCWQKKIDDQISFAVSPLRVDVIRYFSSVAANLSTYSPCHFKIISFDKIADALIKLKVKSHCVSDGERIIEIKGWGNILLYNKNGNAECEKTYKKADIVLDNLAATRLLFGPFEPNSVLACDEFLSTLLPLPLSWNTLDRV